jgi:hypothetical protein
VDEIVSSPLLAPAASALVFDVVALRWADRLGVHSLGRERCQQWPLVQTAVEGGRLDPGLPPPADRSAMGVMNVEDFRPAVGDPLLHGIAEIAPRDGVAGSPKT